MSLRLAITKNDHTYNAPTWIAAPIAALLLAVLVVPYVLGWAWILRVVFA